MAVFCSQCLWVSRETSRGVQGNVKEPQYDVDFFKSFDLVMNGLDNLEARRHVNRLCLAAETPLIESGTAGYLGQVNFQVLNSLPRKHLYLYHMHSGSAR